jgi:hypothetical protein
METGKAEKSSPGTRQTDGENLVWFGEIERKLAKLSMPTFTYLSPLNYFMPCSLSCFVSYLLGVSSSAVSNSSSGQSPSS